MTEKTISTADLLELTKAGATFKLPEKITTIEQFNELVAAIKQVADNEAARIRADIVRNQTNLEILSTLQSMIRKAGNGPKMAPVDLSPIRDLLNEMRMEREAREQVAWDFDIRRDGRGFAQAIRATPIPNTTH